MTIDDIQSSIFEGCEGIDKALVVIKKYIEQNKDDNNQLLIQYIRIKDKYKSLPSLIVNKIHVTTKIKHYVKSGVPTVGKIADTKKAVAAITAEAIDDINKKILSTTEPATRRNREFEKNELVQFFNKNGAHIVTLYDIYNMFLDLKKEINS